MFIHKKGHQPGVYVPLRALFLVFNILRTNRLIKAKFVYTLSLTRSTLGL